MLDFPKKYNQIKTNFSQKENITKKPFFFLPEKYSNIFDLQQIFKLFILDVLHFINYGCHLGECDFLKNPLDNDKNDFKKPHSFLKRQIKSLGLSYINSNFDKNKDNSFSFYIQEFFAENYRKGLFFEDRFLVYRSPKNQTPIDSDLVAHIAKKKNRYTIKYFVSTKNNSLDVITDSPETIFGDVAIAIHPQNKKAKQLKGQEVIIPIINKKIPIIIDERADFTRYGGVYRVTPGHDKLGLEIAKDHNLPIDTYSIDKDGYFTDNAGLFSKKPSEEFFTNIIQSLSDIGNLTKTESLEGSIPVCKRNKEHLIFRNWKGFFVKLPDEFILEFLERPNIIDTNIKDDFINTGYWLASSNQEEGIPIPLWTNGIETFLLDNQRLKEKYNESKQKNGLAFGLFVFHLISIKRLSVSFSAEDFVSVIFDQNKESIEKLFTTIQKKYSETKKEFDGLIKIINNLNEEETRDKNIGQLLDLLDNSFCLEKGKYGNYKFAFEKLDPRTKNIEHYNQVVNYDLLVTAIFLQTLEQNKENNPGIFCTNENTLNTIIKNILFSEYYLKRELIEKFLIIPSLKNNKEAKEFQNIYSKITKTYHPDCIRIGFLSLADLKQEYSKDIFEKWDFSISKFRNSCRYIKTTFFPGSISNSKENFLKNIQQILEKNIDDFNAFDSWIISKTNNLIEENQQIKSPEQIGIFIKNIFDFIENDFSLKYLELIKSAPSEYSGKISLCITSTIILLLRPYLPIITKELLDIFGFENNIDIGGFLNHFSNIQKNYSISLFMEIIDKLAETKLGLGLKKHDAVKIFIRSNPDFIKFAKNNESLFKKTLQAEDIIYLVHHEEIPCGYKEEDIIDISIGLKAAEKKGLSGIHLLEKKLQEKEEYLQHLKHIVQQLNGNVDDSIIQKKKEEISQIKQDVEDLNFEISKCKMRN